MLKRLTERIVLLYDGDRAGYKATMHALQMCVEADVEVLVASRPGHAQVRRRRAARRRRRPRQPGRRRRRRAAPRGDRPRARAASSSSRFEVWGKARGNADARARALEDAARLVAKVADPDQT